MLRDNAGNYSATLRNLDQTQHCHTILTFYKYQVRGLNTRPETIIPDRRYSAQDRRS